MGKIIYEAELNRYLVAEVIGSSWDDSVVEYITMASFGDKSDALEEADNLKRSSPNDRYVVIDSEADDE